MITTYYTPMTLTDELKSFKSLGQQRLMSRINKDCDLRFFKDPSS